MSQRILSPRRLLTATALATAVGAPLALAPAGQATTGLSTGLPVPKVLIKIADGDPFTGRFVLSSIDSSARITAGQINMDFTETDKPFIVGFAEFDGFDVDNRKSVITTNLYPFTYHAKTQKLSADVLSQGSNQKLGTITFDKPTSAKGLSGRLLLNGAAHPVTFKRIDDTARFDIALPRAKQTSATSGAGQLKDSGWGPSIDFTGAYETVSDVAAQGAGTFASLVQYANALSADLPQAVGSTLKMASTSGTLKLHTATGATTYYVTNLRSEGEERSAVVRRGSTAGKVVGTFSATASGTGLAGSVRVGDHTVAVTFQHAG